MLEKRSVMFGAYDTASYGWTLTGIILGDAEQKTNYVEKSGGDGSWDLSTALTDGIPRYKDRPLIVTLECSEGTRDEREELISHMVNTLDGFVWDIVHPDHPNHYLSGRIKVAVEYNDLAHAAVTVTGTCEPWFYRKRETVVEVAPSPGWIFVPLRNSGRRCVIPLLIVDGGSVHLQYGSSATALGEGIFEWPDLVLTPGNHEMLFYGDGALTITYREAVLR